MTTVIVDFDCGYGGWITGYLPHGDELVELRKKYHGSQAIDNYLTDKNRFNNEVRESYSGLLDSIFQKYHGEDIHAQYTILNPTLKSTIISNPNIDALHCTNHDHILVASHDQSPAEFFREIQEKYSFRQSDPNESIHDHVKIWNSKGKPVQLPSPEKSFALAAEVILKSYVECVYDSMCHSMRYFDSMGLYREE